MWQPAYCDVSVNVAETEPAEAVILIVPVVDGVVYELLAPPVLSVETGVGEKLPPAPPSL